MFGDIRRLFYVVESWTLPAHKRARGPFVACQFFPSYVSKPSPPPCPNMHSAMAAPTPALAVAPTSLPPWALPSRGMRAFMVNVMHTVKSKERLVR